MPGTNFVRKLDIRKQVRILRKEEESFFVISEQRETPQLFQTAVFCGTADESKSELFPSVTALFASSRVTVFVPSL